MQSLTLLESTDLQQASFSPQENSTENEPSQLLRADRKSQGEPSTISGTSLLRRKEVVTFRRTFRQNQELSSNNIPVVYWRILFLRPVTGLLSEGSYLERTSRNTEPLPLGEFLLFMRNQRNQS